MKTMKLVLIVLFAFSTAIFAQKKLVNIEKSEVKWTGSKIGSSHNGQVKVKSGYFELKKGVATSGQVLIDMKSITNADLTDASYNKMLVDHLKSDDFFGVEKFPTATFTLTKVSKFKNNKATANGNLTIKGKTQAVSFEITQNGNVYSTQLKVDRSKFDVRYGSGSFFENLGDKVIDDIFVLDIKLVE